jgi:hypothetical protein
MSDTPAAKISWFRIFSFGLSGPSVSLQVRKKCVHSLYMYIEIRIE